MNKEEILNLLAQNEDLFDALNLTDKEKKQLELASLINDWHQQQDRSFEVKSLDQIAANVMRRAEQSSETGLIGISTGLKELDRHTKGLQSKNLYVIGGRPSMGKTSLLISLMMNAVINKHRCLFVTADETNEMIYERVLQSVINEDPHTPHLEKDFTAHNIAVEELNKLPIVISDEIRSINAIERLLANSYGSESFDAVFIDCIQLLHLGSGSSSMSRGQELTLVMCQLKELATSFQIPIIVTSHLSRAVETRGGIHQPNLSDLRESGAIELFADTVILMYRLEYYGFTEFADGNPSEDVTDIFMAKNKHHKTGEFRISFDQPSGRYTDYEEPPTEPFDKYSMPLF